MALLISPAGTRCHIIRLTDAYLFSVLSSSFEWSLAYDDEVPVQTVQQIQMVIFWQPPFAKQTNEASETDWALAESALILILHFSQEYPNITWETLWCFYVTCLCVCLGEHSWQRGSELVTPLRAPLLKSAKRRYCSWCVCVRVSRRYHPRLLRGLTPVRWLGNIQTHCSGWETLLRDEVRHSSKERRKNNDRN